MNFIKQILKSILPVQLKIWMLGVLFRKNSDPRFAFRQADLLLQQGKRQQAAAIYRQMAESGRFEHGVSFEAGRHLHGLEPGRVIDPLFDCAVDNARIISPCSKFQLNFVASGLWISTRLQAEPAQQEQLPYVDIRLGELRLRKHKLSWCNGVAEFLFVVKRSVLAYFPRHGEIRLTAGGDEQQVVSASWQRPRYGCRTVTILLPNGLLLPGCWRRRAICRRTVLC